MPERPPLARSPIEPAAPVVVRDGWIVSGRRSRAPLRIEDQTPLAEVLVRAGSHEPRPEALRVGFGRAARDEHGTLQIGSAPGEWLLVGAVGNGPAIAERIRASLGERFASVLEQTHARALLRLGGERAADVLAKLCAIDLDDRTSPDGSAFRTGVAKLRSLVVRDDRAGVRSYLIRCDRSAGQYVFGALCAAGAEFGIEVDGFSSSEIPSPPPRTMASASRGRS